MAYDQYLREDGKLFRLHERVEIQGVAEMNGHTGELVAMYPLKAIVKMDSNGHEVVIPYESLVKLPHFGIGDRIRVTRGQYVGKMGTVAKASHDMFAEVYLDNAWGTDSIYYDCMEKTPMCDAVAKSERAPLPRAGTNEFIVGDRVSLHLGDGVITWHENELFRVRLYKNQHLATGEITAHTSDLRRPEPKDGDRVRVFSSCTEARLRGAYGTVIALYRSGCEPCLTLSVEGHVVTGYVLARDAVVVEKVNCVPYDQAVGRMKRECGDASGMTKATKPEPAKQIAPPPPTLDQRLIAVGKKYESVIPQIETMRRVLRESIAKLATDPLFSSANFDVVFQSEMHTIENGATRTAGTLESAHATATMMLCAIETAMAVHEASKVVRPIREPARIEPLEVMFDVNGDDDL